MTKLIVITPIRACAYATVKMVAVCVRLYGAREPYASCKTKSLKMKPLRASPNTPTSANTLAFVTTDQPIALIAQVTMPDIEVILFVVFIGLCIFLVLVDK